MQYGVFICHAYRHSDIYERLRALLRGASRFTLRNHSIPDDALLEFKSTDELRSAIRARIARSDVVLALTKPAAQRSSWLKEELKIASELGKPIIAITRNPDDRKSSLVMASATRHVDTWRGEHLARAIREEVRAARRRNRRKAAVAEMAEVETPGTETAPAGIAPAEIAPSDMAVAGMAVALPQTQVAPEPAGAPPASAPAPSAAVPSAPALAPLVEVPRAPEPLPKEVILKSIRPVPQHARANPLPEPSRLWPFAPSKAPGR